MSTKQIYKTAPLQCWPKAKEFRKKYYANYANAHKDGKIRWAGGAHGLDALPAGLGNEVHMSSEGYGASIGHNPSFALECQEEVERRGFARDMCSYVRNYWGSMFLNKYAFGGEFPKPDFALQTHFCCMHGKWYQLVSEHEKMPHFCIDMSVGEIALNKKHLPERVDYVAGQCLDAIDWMQKVTGKEYDDEKLIEAVYNESRSTSLWAEICELNKAIPAPLDEKTMYSLYVLLVLRKASKEVADFYEELKEEVEYRVANGIAAVPNESFRIIHDIQPPWSFLEIFRYMQEFGVVSVGSVYSFGLCGAWDFIDGHMVPAVPLNKQGITLKTREDAVRALAEWHLTKKPILDTFHNAQAKSDYMLSIIKDWHCKGAIMHFNRGCEGISLNCAENKLALSRAGIPVMTYEGNMADDRDFDAVAAKARVDTFVESLGLKKIV